MRETEILTDRKVVFVNRFFYPDHSATSQMLSDLAFDLAKAGKTVEIVTSRLRYDDPTAQLEKYESIKGVNVHRVWTSRFGRGNLAGRAIDYLTFYIFATWKIWHRSDENTTVVAKTDPPLISLVVAPIVWLRGAKLINWLQDLFPEIAANLGIRVISGYVLRLLMWARNISLNAASMNIVLSHRMEALVLAEGVPANKIRVIPNWADGIAINPVPREGNTMRTNWELQNHFVVGYSGNLGLAHEFNTILDSAEILKGRKEILFLFIGDGLQRQAVEKEAIARGLYSVFFKPYQPREQLSESLSVADVHIVSLNPRLEGMIVPSKFYGIAAAGRPTIYIGDIDGEIPAILQKFDCGNSVNQGQGDLLANAITELADDSCSCQRQGSNARIMFEGNFSRVIAKKSFMDAFYQ